jgi:NADPH:quinone reductase-like Zn-dependent oxidoreductase
MPCQILNLKAYVTASPKWHNELKALGAYECFDYKDAEVAEKIKKASGGSIKYGLDTISEKGSASTASKAFSDEGGKLALLRE